ncbi:MAG TPA: hypothetical protein PLD20_33200, partial [Blastocatellia bacterium]|nr:hypothetical protein [Blastocatellia bacterium]
ELTQTSMKAMRTQAPAKQSLSILICHSPLFEAGASPTNNDNLKIANGKWKTAILTRNFYPSASERKGLLNLSRSET